MFFKITIFNRALAPEVNYKVLLVVLTIAVVVTNDGVADRLVHFEGLFPQLPLGEGNGVGKWWL